MHSKTIYYEKYILPCAYTCYSSLSLHMKCIYNYVVYVSYMKETGH